MPTAEGSFVGISASETDDEGAAVTGGASHKGLTLNSTLLGEGRRTKEEERGREASAKQAPTKTPKYIMLLLLLCYSKALRVAATDAFEKGGKKGRR